MKFASKLISIFIIIATIYWGFSDMKPSLSSYNESTDKTTFSLNNALHHLKKITQKAHHVGSDEHTIVQKYLVNELEKLGLETQIQKQVASNEKWLAVTTTENIIARIKGSESGKALLLLTHYDSSQHSSLGASDAGSGVVTILEGIRAFLAKNQQPKNDIIILISDAEELGLLGAKAFVTKHDWAKDVGLVLNFEARGSGGASYMLMETNGKNSSLIQEFLEAKPNYPAANSLMYSVYKMLPNDTDLTVFREQGDINGFNFAFIGDHFDYHTAQDSYERLDRESLLHQADYLETTLNYFSNSDLSNLNSNEDYVYVNFPFKGLLTFPFSWINYLLIAAILLFFVLLFFGISLNKFSLSGIGKGFLAFLLSLILCVGISFGLWRLLLIIHPHYQDMLHGFTYNGYQYIIAFSFLNLWILFKIYNRFFKEQKTTDLLIAPITFWIIINALVLFYLPGAGFFIIPIFCALLILSILVFMSLKEKSKPILFAILSIPTIYIFAPMVKLFPVGLGLKNLFISAIFIVLIFGLIFPIFHQKKRKNRLQTIFGFLTIIFFGMATYNSGFSVDKKKPNSLVYIQNNDTNSASFGTYNKKIDAYTEQIFGENPSTEKKNNAETKSKYNTRFNYIKKTENRNIASALITTQIDTLIGEERVLDLIITPQRKVHKIELKTEGKVTFTSICANGIYLNDKKPLTKENKSFLIYHLGNSDKQIHLSLSFDKMVNPTILMNEISYDLLKNPAFNFRPRNEEMMPMPFVTNDAIICVQKLTF
ncbi:peptidase M28-like protein [Lutibacter sp. Hel_I_33_5]|uniref:M28 family peptidase n=1 Tax=Lutibacter sp. Hel_I_33_5 TaxID=1566289 RepID=UPI0011A2FC13|nr:M28 family peptidase [Lutibacter sp. Hel_I_33_5]TVZ56516.1 peptidase M28-like protein [Lutibacter sp. Hel_I_33_5]